MRLQLSGAALLGTIGALAPYGVAQACEDCYLPVPNAVVFLSADVASNGVLAFTLENGSGRDLSYALPYLSLTVTDELGSPVEGTLEVYEAFDTSVWRPAAPWAVGATYEVAYALDFAALGEDWTYGLSDCGLSGSRSFTVLGAVLVPATLDVATSAYVDVTPTTALADLVCCDDSYPEQRDAAQQPGSCPVDGIELGPGTCSSLQAMGRGVFSFELEVGAFDELTLANLAFAAATPDQDRDFSVGTTTELPCATARVLDLATGDIHSFEHCIDADDAMRLGLQPRDPSEDLLACEGPAYVCALIEDEGHYSDGDWDREDCRYWPSGEPVLPEMPTTSIASSGTSSSDVGSSGSADAAPAAGGCECVARGSDPRTAGWLVPCLVVLATRRRGEAHAGS